MLTELQLHIGQANGKTAVLESYFTSPLKLGVADRSGEYQVDF